MVEDLKFHLGLNLRIQGHAGAKTPDGNCALNSARLESVPQEFSDLSVKRHLSSPGNGVASSRLEGQVSEHGTPPLLAGLGFS